MREIGEAVGLTSPSSVKHQLTALERKGYLRRDPNRPRAIEVVHPDDSRSTRRLVRRPRPASRPASFGEEHLAPQDSAPDPVVRAGRRPDRGRRTDPRRAGGRGRLPAPPPARGRRRPVPAPGRRRLDGRRRDLRRGLGRRPAPAGRRERRDRRGDDRRRGHGQDVQAGRRPRAGCCRTTPRTRPSRATTPRCSVAWSASCGACDPGRTRAGDGSLMAHEREGGPAGAATRSVAPGPRRAAGHAATLGRRDADKGGTPWQDPA